MGLAWFDTQQQAMYKEQEKTWVQPISWRANDRTFHAEASYAYKTRTFKVSVPYEEKGALEPVVEAKDDKMRTLLLASDQWDVFSTERKTVFDALENVLSTEDLIITDVSIVKTSDFLKEIVFSFGEHVRFTAYVEKQVDWSLRTLRAHVGTHTLSHAFSDTRVEKNIERYLFSQMFG